MTITNNYFEEYTNFINELQNRIMKIQLKYNECQSLISSDFAKGFIAKEVAEKMLAVRINQYVPSMDRKYRLSKEEIDFVNEYAALDSSGNILATILKPEYLEKAERLEHILHSVKTIHFYENMDPVSKRVRIKADLITAFSRRISMLKGKLSNIQRIYGENAEKRSNYQQIQAEIDKCTEGMESFDQIMDYDDEKVRQIIESFYKADYSYFNWYSIMELKSLKESPELYSEHTQTMNRALSFSKDLTDNKSKIKELTEMITRINNTLFSFLSSITELDIEEFEEEQLKGIGFFKKGKLQKDNKSILNNLFLKLVSMPGIMDYLQETLYQPEDTIELNDCFNKYLSSIYGEEITFVDLNKFLLKFQQNIISFYKEKIEQTQKELSENVKVNGGIVIALSKSVENGYNQAELHEKAFNVSTIDQKDLLIEGFTEEEGYKIYQSLKEILSKDYTLYPQETEIKKSL